MTEIITDLDARQLADRLTALELHSTSELARLEQERNEARIDAKKSKAYKRVLKVANANLKRERNEAQEKYATEATEHMLAVNKLCNERDEARESLKHITEYGTEEINAAVELRQKLAQALIERDEARTDLEFRRGLYKVQEQYLETARRERDEARAALMRIEDLFIDGTDIYADRENMGLIARAALEEIK